MVYDMIMSYSDESLFDLYIVVLFELFLGSASYFSHLFISFAIQKC